MRLPWRLTRFRTVRYAGASLVASLVDLGSFLALSAAGLWPPGAAALGYTLGIVAHWSVTSRAVFDDRLSPAGYPRMRQQGLFVLSALVGLVLTVAIVWSGGRLGADPRLAKLAAMGASFLAVYALRHLLVFRRR